MLNKIFAVSLTLVLAHQTTVHAGSATEIPEIDTELAAQGVAEQYSDSGFSKVMELLNAEVQKLKDQEIANAIKNQIQILTSQNDYATLHSNYQKAKSLLYSVRSSQLPPRSGGNLIGKALDFMDNGVVKIPYYRGANKPLNKNQAHLESSNLIDTKTGKIYSSPSELTGLSVNQIASLDVRDDNSFWYSREKLAEIKSQSGSGWAHFEHKIEKSMQSVLGASFTLDQARRVLIFDEIKATATSAKVETKDLFNNTWKVKWSEEIHSEAIGSRLYMNLGGKYTDLVYANKGGAKDLILVLSKKSAQAESTTSCDKIASIEKFKKCLLLSTYQFNIAPYILNTGVITQESFNDKNSALSFVPTDKQERLLGREYLVMSETSVEFKPSTVTRLGAISLNLVGAKQDRAKRGFAVFSYWLQNKDSKDDNNRGVIMNNEYIEYVHDLGASLANIWTSALPNEIKTEFGRIEQSSPKIQHHIKVPTQRYIKIPLTVLYLPTAYDVATQADAIWMADKIATLTEQEVRDVVAETKWPGFVQDVMSSRLIARKNSLAELFGFEQKQIQLDQKQKTIALNLDTRASRLAAAEAIDLQLATNGNIEKAADLIEKLMIESGLKMDKNGETNYSDTLYETKDGIAKLMTCNDSILISALESTIRPTGIGRRVSRQSDDKPLSKCLPAYR